MNTFTVADVFAMSVQERIRLVEIIWDSIAIVPESIVVTPEVRAELASRHKEFEDHREAGYSWEQVKVHLLSGTWRTA